MAITPIPAPRVVGRVRPTVPPNDCTLDGPCGFCAALTPAARAVLAESLAVDAAFAGTAVAR